MSDANEDAQPSEFKGHRAGAYATKVAGKVERLAEKKDEKKGKEDDKKPAGGFDATKIPQRPPGYTVKFTFHRASNLPFADIPSFSSDPFIVATISTNLPKRHKQDPNIIWRTTTKRKTTEPEWEETWIVANVPGEGFKMKCRIYDEDPADHDDRLGNIHVHADSVNEQWSGIKNQPFKIKKRMGSKRAYFFRGIAALASRNVPMSGDVYISAEVLGRTEDESGGRMYTIGPCQWSRHYSPMIGRITGTKSAEHTSEDGKKTERYNFQANQIQLKGPVPEDLYHRYVEFSSFVKGMFTGKSLRGWLLNRALHHQHARVYNYDRSTKYGSFPEPCKELSQQFLDLVHYDEGGRIFTYVITLDGQFRFTETGKQFGIDLLSKHTMHSDVSIYIAFSGEFFIRRLKTPNKDTDQQPEHPPDNVEGGPPNSDPPKDPAYYHLIIDNDSGTYRPNKDLLPQLRDFLKSNFPGLKVSTLDCQGDAEKMGKMKDEQREHRKNEGNNVVFAQMSDSSSISSSDEEDLIERAGGAPPKHKLSQRLRRSRQTDSKEAEGGAASAAATTSSRPATAEQASNMAQTDNRHQAAQTQNEAPAFELQGSEVPAPAPEPIELAATTPVTKEAQGLQANGIAEKMAPTSVTTTTTTTTTASPQTATA